MSSDPTEIFHGVYRGARVLVTGHTGFKGAWLCEWLLSLGAEVTGFALKPATNPSLFEQLDLSSRVNHIEGDIRNLGAVCEVVERARPDFVFHLAAQPLVRLSYDIPVETYATNVMGTVHLMEALRLHASASRHPIPAVMVTTDKCYENREWVHSYREEDSMGGHDPYSSSKGAAEIAIAAYRRSYFSPTGSILPPVLLASARAGNVIGGGDWATDRIVPDSIRSLQSGVSIPVRNKIATRPWQHVLEPLSGYLSLGAALGQLQADDAGVIRAGELCSAFNFGPRLTSNRTVVSLIEELLKHWPGDWEDRSNPHAPHEARLLNLAVDKAHHLLHWEPKWNFEETIEQTVTWYRNESVDPAIFTRSQIRRYADAVASATG